MPENDIATLIREHRVLLEYAINEVIAQHRDAQAPTTTGGKPLDYALVQQLVGAARTEALRLNIAVVIALCDRQGEFVLNYRMPGTGVGDIAVANTHATAAALSAATARQDIVFAGTPDITGETGRAPGACPVYLAGELTGAIGISGGSAEQNHYIARQVALLIAPQVAR